MRVLQIGLAAKQGGVESCIVNYYSHLDHDRIQFDFVDIFGEGLAYCEQIKKYGGHIFLLDNCKKRPLKVFKEFKDILRHNKYDIIHINLLSAANLFLILIANIYGKKNIVIVHCHNSSIPRGLARRTLHLLNCHILRRLPVQKWACSIKAGEWLWGKTFNKEDVLANAVDCTIFCFDEQKREEYRKICGFKANEIVLGFVGRLIEQKNPLFLLEIMECIEKVMPNVKLLVIGDGPLADRFKQESERLNLGEKVYIAGAKKKVADWYQAMDIFVLPSLFEGLPMVGIEAQAMGLPCLVSSCVTSELNITGQVRYLPINRGADVWADAIAEYCDNKKNNEFPKNYDITYAAQELYKKYSDLIGDQR